MGGIKVGRGGKVRVLELAGLAGGGVETMHRHLDRLIAVVDGIGGRNGRDREIVQVQRDGITRKLLAVERDREQRGARGVVAGRRAE